MSVRPLTLIRSIHLTVEQAEFLRDNAPVFQCSEAELHRKMLDVAMGLKDRLPVPQGRPPRIPIAIQRRLDDIEERLGKHGI